MVFVPALSSGFYVPMSRGFISERGFKLERGAKTMAIKKGRLVKINIDVENSELM